MAIAALAATAVGSGILLLTLEDRITFVLSNGSRVRLGGVQLRNSGRVLTGPPWKRRLQPLVPYLPGSLADSLRTESYELPSWAPAESLAAWLELPPAAGAAERYCTLRDRHGCRFFPDEHCLIATGPVPVNASLFTFFPRRDGAMQVELMLSPGGAARPAGSVTVGSPVSTQYPVWTAEVLPITHRSGPVSVTVREVTTGWSRNDGKRPAQDAEMPDTRFRIQERFDTPGWALVGAGLSDATGGHRELAVHEWSHTPGTLNVRAGNLCREEPAYRYQLEYSRAASPGARPDLRLPAGTWTPSAVPTRWVSVPLPAGRRLRLSRYNVDGGWILMGDTPLRPGEACQLRGESLPGGPAWQETASSAGREGREQHFQLQVPKEIPRLRLYLNLYRSRFHTFTVKPRWITR